jgi:hypothetical protein
VFTSEQGKLLNQECTVALSSVLRKVKASSPDLHAQFLISDCKIALRYLQYIHQIAIDGYPPMAVSLFRTYFEIICSTMYLAEHKAELDDFLKFGRLMYYEIGQRQKLKGTLLNRLVPDHRELREYFLKKKNQRGGKVLSWHGMTINDLGKAVGMEKYTDQQIARSQYAKASKLVHGDSLLTMLAYNLDEAGMQPRPFAPPMQIFRVDAVGAVVPLFIVLLASVDIGLSIGLKDELDGLNAIWRRVWLETTGVNPQDTIDRLSKQELS